MTPHSKPLTSADLIDSAVNPLPLVVGARLISIDPEDMNLRGTVLAIATDGYIKTRWDDGGESWHTPKNVRVIDDDGPCAPSAAAPRDIEAIALDVLRCAIGWAPEARLVGNVTARELGRLAAPHVTSCPKCGAEPWVNIDCDLCTAIHEAPL